MTWNSRTYRFFDTKKQCYVLDFKKKWLTLTTSSKNLMKFLHHSMPCWNSIQIYWNSVNRPLTLSFKKHTRILRRRSVKKYDSCTPVVSPLSTWCPSSVASWSSHRSCSRRIPSQKKKVNREKSSWPTLCLKIRSSQTGNKNFKKRRCVGWVSIWGTSRETPLWRMLVQVNDLPKYHELPHVLVKVVRLGILKKKKKRLRRK